MFNLSSTFFWTKAMTAGVFSFLPAPPVPASSFFIAHVQAQGSVLPPLFFFQLFFFFFSILRLEIFILFFFFFFFSNSRSRALSARQIFPEENAPISTTSTNKHSRGHT